jgi:hypothetical protein
MNVGFDVGTVHTRLPAILNAVFICLRNDSKVDPLDGLRRQSLEVVFQRGRFGCLVEISDPAKSSIADGRRQLESQLLVAELVHLLDDEYPQYFLSSHPPSASVSPLAARDVRHHPIEEPPHSVQAVAYGGKLSCVFVIDWGLRQGLLSFYLRSHGSLRFVSLKFRKLAVFVVQQRDNRSACFSGSFAKNFNGFRFFDRVLD